VRGAGGGSPSAALPIAGEESPGNTGRPAPERGDVREGMPAEKKITARKRVKVRRRGKSPPVRVATSGAVRTRGCKTKYIPEAPAHGGPPCFFNALESPGGVGCLDK